MVQGADLLFMAHCAYLLFMAQDTDSTSYLNQVQTSISIQHEAHALRSLELLRQDWCSSYQEV